MSEQDPVVKAFGYSLDGRVRLEVALPPPPDWTERIDAAFERLRALTRSGEWTWLGLLGVGDATVCVLAHRGRSAVDSAVAGVGSYVIAAIDDAIRLANVRDGERSSTIPIVPNVVGSDANPQEG